MTVTLHRCSARWVKGPHPCWKVEKALIDTGTDYKVVTSSGLPWQRHKRTALIEATGQNVFPAIVFEDGSVYKEESADMAKKIRAGELGSSSPAQ
jgi:predicted aspartyl protease